MAYRKQNPFVYGSVVSGANYLARKELETKLTDNILSGQNTVLQGERRVGKTSLAINVAQKAKKRSLIMVDFLLLSDAREIVAELVSAAMRASEEAGVLKAAARSLAKLRPTMSFDAITGAPTFSISSDIPRGREIERLSDALDGIHLLSKHRPLIILFDEFQSVKNMAGADKLLATLRSRIQLQQKVPYIFSGSDRTQINDIFTSPSSPFYKSAQTLTVETFESDSMWNFVRERFGDTGISMAPSFRDYFKDSDISLPGDIQQVCNFAWNRIKVAGRKKAEEQDAYSAIGDIIKAEEASFQNLLHLLSPSQRKLIRAIAHFGGKSIYAAEFMQSSNINSSSAITKAANQLLKKRLVTKADGAWKIWNPFFRIWLSGGLKEL